MEKPAGTAGAGGGVRGWVCNPCNSVILERFHSTNLRNNAIYQEGYEPVLIGTSLCDHRLHADEVSEDKVETGGFACSVSLFYFFSLQTGRCDSV